MEPSKEQLQLSDALWALNRIVRKQGGFLHSGGGETCDCPRCIARDALERIRQHEQDAIQRSFVK